MQLSSGAVLWVAPNWSQMGMERGEAPFGVWTKPICASGPHHGRHLNENRLKVVTGLQNSAHPLRRNHSWAERHGPFSLGQRVKRRIKAISFLLQECWAPTLSPGTTGADSNSDHCSLLLGTYYMLGTTLHTLYTWCFSLFITILWRRGCKHHFTFFYHVQVASI